MDQTVNQTMNQLAGMYQANAVVVNLVSFAITVLSIVSMWMVFSKAGEGGWKILIPIYNEYIRFKIADCKKRYWVSLALSIVSVGLLFFGAWDVICAIVAEEAWDQLLAGGAVCLMAACVLLLVVWIIGITVNFKMARVFGLPGVFGLGLWLLPVIFYAILAFSGSIQYVNGRRGSFEA